MPAYSGRLPFTDCHGRSVDSQPTLGFVKPTLRRTRTFYLNYSGIKCFCGLCFIHSAPSDFRTALESAVIIIIGVTAKSTSAHYGPDVVLCLADITSLNCHTNPMRQIPLSPFYG